MPEAHGKALAESVPFTAVKRVLDQLDIEAALDAASSGMEAALSIFQNIMEAETEEEVFKQATAGTTSGKDFTNVPFRLKPENITWKKSFMEGFPFFALLRVTDMENEKEMVLNCGGVTFVAVIRRLLELEEAGKETFSRHAPYGGKPLMLTAKPVASGFSVLIPVPVADPHLKGQKKTASAAK